MANEYRVNAVSAEVWASFQSQARTHSITVEVWRTITSVPTATRRRQQQLLS